jgi:hypothetical protein
MAFPGKLVVAVARSVFTPFVPAGNMLGYKFWLHKLSGEAEPELEHLDEIVAQTGIAIDVGANLGFYTFALSKLFKRVYAIEMGEAADGLIHKQRPRNIEMLGRGAAEGGRSSTAGDRLLPRLDKIAIEKVDFLRIDVGSEAMELLARAAATIERSRPMVLFRLKKEQFEDVNAWFRALDYKHCYLEDFNEVRGSAWNHVYVPFERLASFGIARPAD